MWDGVDAVNCGDGLGQSGEGCDLDARENPGEIQLEIWGSPRANGTTHSASN